MFFGNTLIIIGAALTANSRNEGMFLGGRFLVRRLVLMLVFLADVYVPRLAWAEDAPVPVRSPSLLSWRRLSGEGPTLASSTASTTSGKWPLLVRSASLPGWASHIDPRFSGMMVATGRWDSELAWRLPLYIQMVPAALNFLLVFLCPESYVRSCTGLWRV